MESYHLIIVGVGPAGLTASIYASRYRLKNLVIGKQLGGELALAHKIENYPGFRAIKGTELAQKMGEQVEGLGAKILYEEIGKIERAADQEKGFVVETAAGKKYYTQALIVATGSERRRLGIPGEKELVGRGISYCTTCDAPFYRGKIVGVVGGSDAAVTGAIHTAEFAKQIFLIYRGEQLRAEPIWLEELKKLIDSGQVTVIYKTNLVKVLSKAMIQNNQDVYDLVGGVELDNPYSDSTRLPLDGLFIEIGGVPGTALIKPLGVKLTKSGHVQVDEGMRTDVTGLFCAGDMVDKSAVIQQAVIAMAQGAMAAASAYKFLKGSEAPRILGI